MFRSALASFVVVLALTTSTGCGLMNAQRPRQWVVAKTPAGMACYRECLAMKNQCSYSGAFGDACNIQHERCKSTCPGATREELQ